MVPPVVLDIDGTLTMVDAERKPAPIDPRLLDRLRRWDAPVILATGKAFPFPVALCQFTGLPVRVIAETGGIVCNGDRLEVLVDTARTDAIVEAMRDRQVASGDPLDLINRWRETEVAFLREIPLDELEAVAADHGFEVVDTGYAYHVKDPGVSKGKGLDRLLQWESIDSGRCVAIGDSANDVSLFDRVGHAVAVANAAQEAKAAADHVAAEGHAEGTLATLDRLEQDQS